MLALTQKLLDAVASADWPAYEALCAPDMTCFEPETEGELVHGLGFHRQFFVKGGHMGPHRSTVIDADVRMLGPDAALVCYNRVVESAGTSRTFQETRVWQKIGDEWKHVHFHRSERQP